MGEVALNTQPAHMRLYLRGRRLENLPHYLQVQFFLQRRDSCTGLFRRLGRLAGGLTLCSLRRGRREVRSRLKSRSTCHPPFRWFCSKAGKRGSVGELLGRSSGVPTIACEDFCPPVGVWSCLGKKEGTSSSGRSDASKNCGSEVAEGNFDFATYDGKATGGNSSVQILNATSSGGSEEACSIFESTLNNSRLYSSLAEEKPQFQKARNETIRSAGLQAAAKLFPFSKLLASYKISAENNATAEDNCASNQSARGNYEVSTHEYPGCNIPTPQFGATQGNTIGYGDSTSGPGSSCSSSISWQCSQSKDQVPIIKGSKLTKQAEEWNLPQKEREITLAQHISSAEQFVQTRNTKQWQHTQCTSQLQQSQNIFQSQQFKSASTSQPLKGMIPQDKEDCLLYPAVDAAGHVYCSEQTGYQYPNTAVKEEFLGDTCEWEKKREGGAGNSDTSQYYRDTVGKCFRWLSKLQELFTATASSSNCGIKLQRYDKQIPSSALSARPTQEEYTSKSIKEVSDDPIITYNIFRSKRSSDRNSGFAIPGDCLFPVGYPLQGRRRKNPFPQKSKGLRRLFGKKLGEGRSFTSPPTCEESAIHSQVGDKVSSATASKISHFQKVVEKSEKMLKATKKTKKRAKAALFTLDSRSSKRDHKYSKRVESSVDFMNSGKSRRRPSPSGNCVSVASNGEPDHCKGNRDLSESRADVQINYPRRASERVAQKCHRESYAECFTDDVAQTDDSFEKCSFKSNKSITANFYTIRTRNSVSKTRSTVTACGFRNTCSTLNSCCKSTSDSMNESSSINPCQSRRTRSSVRTRSISSLLIRHKTIEAQSKPTVQKRRMLNNNNKHCKAMNKNTRISLRLYEKGKSRIIKKSLRLVEKYKNWACLEAAPR